MARGQRILNIAQLITGLFVIGLGSSVYLIDRPVRGLPYVREYFAQIPLPPQFLSDIGLVFPAFAHTVGFALLTAAFIARSRTGVLAAAALWGAVNLVFEFGQHPAVAPWITGQLLGEARGSFLGNSLRCYFQNGTFDPCDVAAIVAGSGVAYVVVSLTRDKGGQG
jgi:hypothetical protein